MRTSDVLTVAQAGVEELYEQNSGRVFAYCYSRVGSRNVAEWAVNATFDRARAASANGGISEPRLDWLLRTADKFCAPKLCLDARPLDSMIVHQDWRGRSFDEIANELEARYARLEEERNRLTPWRRVLGAFNVAPALSWIKGLLGGIGAVKVTAAGVAVLGAIAVAGTPVGAKLRDVVSSDSTPPAPAATPQSSKPARGSAPAASAGRATPSKPAASTTRTSADKKSNRTAAKQAGEAKRNGSADATGAGRGGAGTPAGHGRATTAAPAQGGHSQTGVSASRSGTTPKAGDKPAMSVPTPTLPATTPVAPKPTLPTATVPSTPSIPTVSTPTVSTPTVPDTSTTPVDTPTGPTVSTPAPPGTPSVPDPPSVPSTPSVPGVPSASSPPSTGGGGPTVTVPKLP